MSAVSFALCHQSVVLFEKRALFAIKENYKKREPISEACMCQKINLIGSSVKT